jgi:hypothetical protein
MRHPCYYGHMTVDQVRSHGARLIFLGYLLGGMVAGVERQASWFIAGGVLFAGMVWLDFRAWRASADSRGADREEE